MYIMACKDGIIRVISACLHELFWHISCAELLLYPHWFIRGKPAEIRRTALLKLLSEKESIVRFTDRRPPQSRMSIMEIILTGDAEDILKHTVINSLFRPFSPAAHCVWCIVLVVDKLAFVVSGITCVFSELVLFPEHCWVSQFPLISYKSDSWSVSETHGRLKLDLRLIEGGELVVFWRLHEPHGRSCDSLPSSAESILPSSGLSVLELCKRLCWGVCLPATAFQQNAHTRTHTCTHSLTHSLKHSQHTHALTHGTHTTHSLSHTHTHTHSHTTHTHTHTTHCWFLWFTGTLDRP